MSDDASEDDVRRDLPSASIVKAKYRADGAPEFDAADFKEMEARARGPDVLTPQEMAIVLEAKEEGNAKFKAGRVEEACQKYNCALQTYANRPGGTPDQRREKSKLYANRAECLLRLEQWQAAEQAASKAIQLDADNVKAHYRRARALEVLGGDEHLEAALEALGRIEARGGMEPESEKLRRRLHAARDELRLVRRRDAGCLRRAFVSGDLKLTREEYASSTSASASVDAPAPATVPSWQLPMISKGAETQRRYLIDVYRTAVEDARQAGTPGRAAHGLGAPSYSPASLLMDFLIFCKLLRDRGVLPSEPPWDWDAFLTQAAPLLLRHFHPEKSQPAALYGPEAGSARAFRALVAILYDCADGGGGSGDVDGSGSGGDRAGGVVVVGGGGGGGGGGGDGNGREEGGGEEGGGSLAGRSSSARSTKQPTNKRRTTSRSFGELREEWMRAVGYVDRAGGDGDEDSSVAPRLHLLSFDRSPAMFNDVGGLLPWRRLLNDLAQATGRL